MTVKSKFKDQNYKKEQLTMKTSIRAGFKDFKISNKGEVSINLSVKGELSDEQILTLHKLKGIGMVFADLHSGQADIGDYHDDEAQAEPYKGLSYTVSGDGNVNVADEDQLTLDAALERLDEVL
jgi:hypothetical protein